MEAVNILLFEGFDVLDVMGPAEVLCGIGDSQVVRYISRDGGVLRGSAFAEVATERVRPGEERGILLIPGGMGTRTLVRDEAFIAFLQGLASNCQSVLTVCTGSTLLARTGLLDGRMATGNKAAWAWVTEQGRDVKWTRKARWVVDGRFYTSSGLTAGIDMALGFVADRMGRELARGIATRLEYLWNEDRDADPFA